MKLNRTIIPRRWQVEAIEHWARNQRGIARVITGGGKTVFAYLCLERFFERYPDGRAIIVVPTLALLDQWYVDICDSTNSSASEVVCYSGSVRPKTPARINIVVINTARHISQKLCGCGSTILIVDECHRAGAVENSRALEGNHKATLGLSATPERESDGGFESRIVPSLGPIIYVYDYPQAKSDNVIVDFNLVNIGIELEQNDVDRVLSFSNAKYGQSKEPVRRDVAARETVVFAEYAMRIPWAVKLALQHRQERVIIFHERVASLATISNLLAEYGQNSVTYHSRLSEAHRRDNLRLFRTGMVNMLITCRALDEGANVPEANVAIIAQSTSSTRQRIQRLGRVLRPATGKDNAVVYTLYSGADQRNRLAAEAASLEGIASVIWKQGVFQ